MVAINQPIDVITISDKSGKISPIKIRIKDKNGDEQVFPVKVIARDVEQQGKGCTVIKFNCRFRDGEIEKSCELHYRIQETRWFLYWIK